jgi:plasmid stability protein
MPSLHVRDLPEAVVEALKRRARVHHRSLQGEVQAILEEAARAAPPAEGYPPLELEMSRQASARPWTREDIYDDRGR